MKRWIIPLLVGIFGLSGLTLATTALPAAAYNVSSIATTAAYTAEVQAGQAWTTGTFNCVVFNNAVMIQAQPPGIKRSTLQDNLIGPDQALATYPACGSQSDQTPGAKEAVDTGYGSRIAHDTSWCTSGPYNYWWNVNKNVASAWLIMQWFSFACFVGENDPPSPTCINGASWPNVSVNITTCENIRNDAFIYSTDRMIFTIHIQVLFFSKDLTYWEWANNYGNGFEELGCHVGFC
jgi:hypothetical protein